MTTTISGEALLAQLNWRYATKSFDPERKISPDDWAALEKALILTPTSYGFQPYRFVVITDQAMKEQLVARSWGNKQIAQSSHYVVFAAKHSVNEADVDHYLARVAEVRAVSVESLAGFKKALLGDIVEGPRSQWQHEWGSRQAYLALIDPVKYDELLGLPATGYRTVVACAAGYRAAGDKYAGAPKVRFPAEELLIHI